ncbi:hypothetical protein NHQ30_010907 [Ciborinia camelliae]|nr:hypothetical protein NHQ30_010907 [Ciborinia camelliae]
MASLSGIDFRKKFATLFEIDPLLSNNEAYDILRANSFDVPNTCLDVATKARKRSKKEEFWVPQKALNQLEVTGRLRGIRNTPSLTPENSQSDRSKVTINRKSLDREIWKGLSKVNLGDIDSLDDKNSEDEAGSVIIVEDSHIHQDKDSDDEAESVIIVEDSSVHRNNSSPKRSFSYFEISDESDADISSYDSDSDPNIDYTSQSSKSRSANQNDPRTKRTKLTQESGTRTTQWISKIAGTIFGRRLMPVGTDEDQTSEELASKNYHEALSQASTAEEFLLQIPEEQIEYQAGDNVLVQLGNQLSPLECVLIQENLKGKIQVDFRGKNVNSGVSGVGSIEEEYFASPDRYFYRLNHDIELEKFSEASEMRIQDRETPLENYECCAFHIAKEKKKEEPLKVLSTKKGRTSTTGFIYKDTEYHVKDFVYFVSKATSTEKKPYHIGQIQYIRATHQRNSDSETEIGESGNNESDISLRVDVYERYDDHFQATRSEEMKNNFQFVMHDERRVFLRKSKTLSPESLDGHCFVMHIDHIDNLNTYKDLDDTFWVQDQIPRDVLKESITVKDLKPMPENHLRYSKESKERLEREKEKAVAKENGTKLRTLDKDIFSGAGGLSQGFHESGVIGTTYAIEFDTAASETFKRNFPDAIVYNQDANKLLEWIITHEAGLNGDVFYDIQGNAMADMPSKGEIDMIIGGPPCPGWSSLNRYKNTNKHCDRRELIATYLSYVDFYRPKYFLLENVMGLVHHKLDCTDVPDMNAEDRLLKGAVKFIFRVLTSLGYQCQYASLQAGVYGSPSSRTRVIFWASLPGYELPQYPQATHIFDGMVFKSPHRFRRSAPHWPVTIGDSISDLPRFEWINPHIINPETPAQKSSRLKRDQTVTQYSSLDSPKTTRYAGLIKQAYASDPLSEYQRKMRKSVPRQLLQNHTIHCISTKETERLCNIPILAGANYKNMPVNLLPDFLQTARANSRNISSGRDDYRGRYGRQSIDQSFKVVTTSVENAMSIDWTLHPYSHRSYSAREFARAQGFPDSFTWDMKSTKMTEIYKQIGNAVPVPLARALGNELWKVLQDGSIRGDEIDPKDMDDQEEVELENETEQNLNISDEVMTSSEVNLENIDVIELKDEVDQDMEDEEEVVATTMRQEGTRINTGGSRDDAIMLDDSD